MTIRKNIGLAIVATSLLVTANLAQAESKYIKDVWNVSLYTQADSASASLGLLSSGTKLEVLGREGSYTQVKTSTGEIGWTKSTYLVDGPTHDIQLKAAERKIGVLNRKIEQLSQGNLSAELSEKLAQAQADHEKLHAEYSEQKLELESLQKQIKPAEVANQRKEQIIRIVTIGLCALLCGFVVGKRLTEEKVKAKFNGIKVW